MKYEIVTDYLVCIYYSIIGFKCNTPSACNIMPFSTNPFPVGLTMKFTKIRMYNIIMHEMRLHGLIKGLTPNAMIRKGKNKYFRRI